jgi:hypothetical protein
LSIRAAQRAALTAGSLALPPGPLGWLTLLPELLAIWKIQGQLVSDIAAAYGRHATLGREQMMWCLFRHTAAQAFRDLVVRMGDRLIFRRMSYGIAQSVARQIGTRLGRRMVGNGVTRWLPVVGALGRADGQVLRCRGRVRAAVDVAVRHVTDEIQDRLRYPAMLERSDDGGYLLAGLGHAWLRGTLLVAACALVV